MFLRTLFHPKTSPATPWGASVNIFFCVTQKTGGGMNIMASVNLAPPSPARGLTPQPIFAELFWHIVTGLAPNPVGKIPVPCPFEGGRIHGVFKVKKNTTNYFLV